MKYFWLMIFSFLSFASSVHAADSVTTNAATTAIQQALQLKLDQDQQWYNLIDYRRDFLFFWKRGEADNPNFYLGNKWDPRTELVANIEAIFNPAFTRKSPDGSLDERAQCIFPGRFMWLKRKLPKVEWPQVKCPRYENFRDILDAHSATYVFSSYYLNNPSSAFGHSLLRLNHLDHSVGERKYELLDFGVGYTAIATSSNAIVYSFAGLFGLFAGRFETHPFYYKVREYNDFENRDLWEYDLNFTPEEIQLLVAHLFELDSGGFNYVYFTENCAYRILAAMDTARPSLRLIERSKMFFLPSDSMRTVAETPDFIKGIHYRPSGRAIFKARLATLNSAEEDALNQFRKDENVEHLVAGRNETEKRELLDAAMDYIDFKFADDVLHETGHFHLKKQILLARSEVSQTSPTLEVPVPRKEAPDLAHGSSRLSLGSLWQNGEQSMTFAERFVLNDLLDPVSGFSGYSEMEMGDFAFTWDQQHTHRLQIEKFTLLQIVSLAPWDEINHALSWRLDVGMDRLYQESCNNCLPVIASGGVGLSKEWNDWLGGLWLRGAASYSSGFYHDKEIVGLGPAFLGKYHYSHYLSLLAEAWYRYDYKAVRTDYRDASLGAQVNFTKDLGVRGLWESDREYRLELNYYY